MRRAFIALGLIGLLFGVYALLAGRGNFGEIDGARVLPKGKARSIADSTAGVTSPAGQILFGDLHVHTTLSSDAFIMNLPMMGGAGALSPADACDFARHCAALDFWSINDHANSIYPEDWRNTVEAIRACNTRGGDPANPDTVAFLGWEWTQAGLTADTHYGHKNVVLAHIDDDRIPSRPIAAKANPLLLGSASPFVRGALSLLDRRFNDLSRRIAAQEDAPICGEGNVRDLDIHCREVAPTPPELFRKLDEWGHEAIVIPHGTAWGVYTPPDSVWDKQLEGAMQDPDRQTLLEVYSGHGDSEVYRDWRAATEGRGTAGQGDAPLICPEERPDYLPPCRQAGRIIRARCLAQGETEVECEARAITAQTNAIGAGKDYIVTLEEGTPDEWKDAGQCRDCNQPSFNYVPTGSAQYIAAIGNFDEDPEVPRRFRMGFMASSDNHSARPGTGYKEIRAMTDGGFDRPENSSSLARSIRGGSGAGVDNSTKSSHSTAVTIGETSPFTALADVERTSSFQYTGGLIAAHTTGRDRESIWDSLKRRAVYGTSGPRILLWFDLVRESETLPMGTEIVLAEMPRFSVRAVGSFEQNSGCPDASAQSLGAEALERLCLGECYHPSDRRRPIERIDIIRIRPQVTADEEIGLLVEDPWQSFECPGDPQGCVAQFADEEFLNSARDAVYYARVFEAPSPTVNGSPLGCERDETGSCVALNLCPDDEPCLQPDRARAWSSPIYVDHPAARRSR